VTFWLPFTILNYCNCTYCKSATEVYADLVIWPSSNTLESVTEQQKVKRFWTLKILTFLKLNERFITKWYLI
jgi:hypothetical protein